STAPGFPGGFYGPNIVLVDGKATPIPAHLDGAVRIRAINNPNLLANYGAIPQDEIGLLFEVRAEPKIQIQQLLGVKIDKAIDNLEQTLTPVVASADVPQQIFPGGKLVQLQMAQPAIARIQPVYGNGYYGPGNTFMPARLKKAEKEAKLLKEVRGTVS